MTDSNRPPRPSDPIWIEDGENPTDDDLITGTLAEGITWEDVIPSALDKQLEFVRQNCGMGIAEIWRQALLQQREEAKGDPERLAAIDRFLDASASEPKSSTDDEPNNDGGPQEDTEPS